MLLERRPRARGGVRMLRRDSAPFGTQLIPTRVLTVDDVDQAMRRLPTDAGRVVTSALSPIETDRRPEP